ncbi:Uncharacterised protein [Klebsiella pneumoniae]|uniref:hypothetical protein n=1 Tax=Klebsiella/Raoultella group TaxID=2890311 RepID=UPI0009BBBEB1|nr:hypothetical protein [Klebsiella pneumoniae]EKU6354823.1 hypothetical protein [Klebsiella quasipneumoniae]MCQ0779570.1 hypothetical protein [Klebsiella pneumoniae]SLS03003.1 Uncharacterised protein [Klebsiella pneumoniae]SLT32111.1 Uncharacterised protein [Klebsiella pneumoniae]SLT33290.1 Uncharacterised protein [Klebsiella pneumoniae]
MSGLRLIVDSAEVAKYAKSVNVPVGDGLVRALLMVGDSPEKNYDGTGNLLTKTGNPVKTTDHSYTFNNTAFIDTGYAWAGDITIFAVAKRRISALSGKARCYATSWFSGAGGAVGLLTLQDSNLYAHAIAKNASNAFSFQNVTIPIASGSTDNLWQAMAQRISGRVNTGYNLTQNLNASLTLADGLDWATRSDVTIKIGTGNGQADTAVEDCEIACVFIFNRALTDAEITSMHAWISEWGKNYSLIV